MFCICLGWGHWEGVWLSAVGGVIGKGCDLWTVGRLCVKVLGTSEEGKRLLSSGLGSSQEASHSTCMSY